MAEYYGIVVMKNQKTGVIDPCPIMNIDAQSKKDAVRLAELVMSDIYRDRPEYVKIYSEMFSRDGTSALWSAVNDLKERVKVLEQQKV